MENMFEKIHLIFVEQFLFYSINFTIGSRFWFGDYFAATYIVS